MKKRFKIGFAFLLFASSFLLKCSPIVPQVLNPPYFNIAEGRNISATATCGEGVPEPELFCKIVGSNWLDESDNINLIAGQACDYCDPNDPKKAHPPQYAIDGTERWWQSPPLSRGTQFSKVNLTLDLGQEFNVAYVFIKMGNSPRPGVWILERSRDYGKTFTPWQYFADTPQECSAFFGPHTLQPITRDDSVICETKFSKLVPLENGEIAISLINGRPSAENFSMSTILQEWTTATNIQLRFLRPKTTLGHLLSVAREEPTVTRRYFYSVKDINIGGQCVCNGHASQCDQISAMDPLKLSCSCQHNTCGLQCEQCCNGYQQYEWRRATVDDPFVCEKCNCHGHSNECRFDKEIAAKNQSKNIHGNYLGGGVCTNCQHNTTGINCDRCRDGYFRPADKSLDAIDVCQVCRCDLKLSTGNCSDETGQCECRKNYKAPDCDQCEIGYFGYPECQECHCFPNGTLNNLCELPEGDCPCKEGYGGKYCKQCSEGYYGFPDCKPCRCSLQNSIDNVCDSETGQCKCQTNFGGLNCDQCNVGFYQYPRCEACICTLEGSTKDVCDTSTGECYCKDGYERPFCNKCSAGYYGFPDCIKCDCNAEGSMETSCENDGKCKCKPNFGGTKCGDCGPGYFNFPKCEQCKCHWRGSQGSTCDHSGNCLCLDRYEGQKCDQCKEGYYNFPYCEECNCNPAGLVAEFGGCDKVEIGKLCECKERVKGRICNQCKDLYWNLQMNNPYGCEECQCNRNGTISHIGICDTITGNCWCKTNVQGRVCDYCRPNTYRLDAANLFGCVDCQCDIGGAISEDCDKRSGQCRCKSRIRGKTCSETLEATYYPSFYQLLYEAEDWFNPTGSPARFGYDENVFPNHSWRGYAIFGPLQKEIFTNLTITKTSIYKIILHYVNRNPDSVQGQLKFIPYEWMNEEEQAVQITMEPSDQPKLLYVTGRQSNTMVSLGVGPWQVFFQVDKPMDLFVDYFVLLPQAYYDPGLFRERHTGPCLYNPDESNKNLSCILHSYPGYPMNSTNLPAINGRFVSDNSPEQIPPNPIKMNGFQDTNVADDAVSNVEFVQIGGENGYGNLRIDFQAENNRSNMIVLNYHTPNNRNESIMVRITVQNLNKNQTQTADNILSACPYLFVCRKAVTTSEGRILTIDAAAEDSIQLNVELLDSKDDPNQPVEELRQRRQSAEEAKTGENDKPETLNLNSVEIFPSDSQPYVYIEPSFVCVFKNQSCVPSNFPLVSEAIKIEAETDQKPEQIVELKSYNPGNAIQTIITANGNANANNGGGGGINGANGSAERPVGPKLVQLNETMQSIDIRGQVPRPGPYYFILNYYQPDHPPFEMDALIQNGHLYSGVSTLEHCPNVGGCRAILKQRDSDLNATAFNIQKNFMLTLKVPTLPQPIPVSITGANKMANAYLDYVLVVPAEKFQQHVMHSEPVDTAKNILSECIKNNYYIDPDTASDYCRSLVFSTTVDFNGGALPCDCNIDGSYDHKCQNFGGQCKCKPNVIGRDCSRCKNGYYGWPNCKKCDCPPTAVCHPITGTCTCPKGVTGKDCDKCLPLTFGFDKIIGCVDCACNPRGVLNRDISCDLESGQCNCKQNIVGRTCDKCKPGFFAFPTCQLCRCDVRGTTPDICDQNSARCFCKKNVDGAYCDRCKRDSYFLEESNQHGCTKCFCFGNTDRCTGSSLVFEPIPRTTQELELYNVTIQDNLLEVNRLKKNEDYELDYNPETDEFSIRTSFAQKKSVDKVSSTAGSSSSAIYILLPPEYLGNRIMSYGGELQYQIVNKIQSNDHEPSAPMPDIILVGNNFTLIHEHREQPVINEIFPIKIKLLAKEFKQMDGAIVQREQLMMTMVDLHYIFIRVKYFDSNQDTIDISLKFKMDTAMPKNAHQALVKDNSLNPGPPMPISTGPSIRLAKSVEQCMCPPNYRGYSCEECAEGYYRIKQGPYLGACIKCNCNGHSNECDPVTGKCFNCKYNTQGDHCERCVAGFYGDAHQGTPNDCLICACPLPVASNNFATSCEVSASGSVLSCNCKEGYMGTRCEICGAGHYGQPQIVGQMCQKCECNNNIDVTDLESCDAFTGICQKCLFNSAGDHCEKCADWFYGDSVVAKNCTECSCNQCGSENCDHQTAICKCKPNVIGKNCDQCSPGFYGFSTCMGCQPCNCGEASHEMNCDDTGQCPCKSGVEGKTCEICKPGFWGYSKYGCTSCGCNEKYSRVKQCNQFTGQCQCLPGVVGAKCEKCPDRWVLIQESGCRECDDCVHTLLDDADQIAKDVEIAESMMQNTSNSVLAIRKLSWIKEKEKNYSESIRQTFADTEDRQLVLKNFTKLKKDSEELMENIEKLDIKYDSLEKNALKILAKVNKAYNDSILAENRAKAVRQLTVQVVENVQQLESSLSMMQDSGTSGLPLSPKMQNTMAWLEESEKILNELKQPNDYSRYDIDLVQFNETLERATKFYNLYQKTKENIEKAAQRNKNMSNLIKELKNLTNQARSDTFDAERIIQRGLKETVLNALEELNTYLNKTLRSLEDSKKLLADTRDTMDQVENMKIDAEQQETLMAKEMNDLVSELSRLTESLPEIETIVPRAEEHARQLMQQVKELNESMLATKNQATDPLRAANAYDDISSTVDSSMATLQELNEEIGTYLDGKFQPEMSNEEDVTSAMIQEIMNKIQNMRNQLQEREAMIEEVGNVIEEKLDQFKQINQSVANLEQIDQSDNNITKIYENIKKQVEDVTEKEQKINETINKIDQLKANAKDLNDYSEFVNDVKEGKDYVDRFQRDVERIKNISTSDDIVGLNSEFNQMKSAISGKISDLKKRIQLARHQANNIRVAVGFNGDSVLELNNPANLVEASTYNNFSLRFQDAYMNGLLAYIGNPVVDDNLGQPLVKRDLVKRANDASGSDDNNQNGIDVAATVGGAAKRKTINHDYMGLELRNGRVVLIWDLGTGNPAIIENDHDLRDNGWHQVFVERFGRLIKLTVITNDQRTEASKVAPGSASVFNLDREQSRIFIGGAPKDVQLGPQIMHRNFYGNIATVFWDNEPMGLWNAKHSYNVQGAPTYEPNQENTIRFNGNSYIIFPKSNDFKDSMFVSIEMKTFNKNGLLFLVGEPIKKNYLSIELYQGRIAVKYDLGHGVTTILSRHPYNDGQWHLIRVNRDGKECLLTVDNRDEQTGFSNGLNADLFTDDNIHVGGFRGIIPYYEVTKEGFDGCIRNLQVERTRQNFNNYKESFGVTNGCSTLVRIVSFGEQFPSFVVFRNQVIARDPLQDAQDLVQITFKFRTLSKTGLLLHLADEESDAYVSVSLSDGMLMLFISSEQSLRTENQYYNDNKWHFITINFITRNIELNVDDINSFNIVVDNQIDIHKLATIHVGGFPNDNRNAEFTGCIGDITINYHFLNFANAADSMNAQFKKCPLSASEEEILVPSFKDIHPQETPTSKQPLVEYLPPIGNCKLPPIPQDKLSDSNSEEKRFGNTLWSRYEFPISSDVAKGLENESGFQLKFKTTQPEGILFYITSSNNIDFVGLYFLNGKLHYSFDCGSGRGVASMPKNYGDNVWHDVTFSRKGRNGLLRVDDETLEVSSTGSTSSLNVKSPIYVGGVPKELRAQIKGHLKSADKNDYNYAMASFSGCLKDLKVRDLQYRFQDGRDYDVAPCSNQTENGHFFHYEGGFIRLFDEFRVRVEFSLTLEIKPRKSDGILAAVFGKSDYLVLYLDKGKLFFSVDNGAYPITASIITPDGICDGKWHTIKAIKMKNVAMLTLDDQPPSISTGQVGISSTDTKDPLYVGGLPDKLKQEKTVELNNVKDNYLGCLRIKSINSDAPTLNNAKIEGHVTLNTCPLV